MKLVNTFNSDGVKRPVFAAESEAEAHMVDAISNTAANWDGFPASTYVDLETGRVYIATFDVTIEAVPESDADDCGVMFDELKEELEEEGFDVSRLP